jgi:hypothetical protein
MVFQTVLEIYSCHYYYDYYFRHHHNHNQPLFGAGSEISAEYHPDEVLFIMRVYTDSGQFDLTVCNFYL